MERFLDEFVQGIYVCVKQNVKLGSMIIAFENRIEAGNFDGLSAEQIASIRNRPLSFYSIMRQLDILGDTGTATDMLDKLNELKEKLKVVQENFRGIMREIAGQDIMRQLDILGDTGTATDMLDKLNELKEKLKVVQENFRGIMREIAGQEYWDSFEDDEQVRTIMSRMPAHFAN
uniref:Uncharacterized protein n=1 Tax=Lutzomyia longipalpis TaxID=7200 RepID=A0A1B0CGP0_LUTLO